MEASAADAGTVPVNMSDSEDIDPTSGVLSDIVASTDGDIDKTAGESGPDDTDISGAKSTPMKLLVLLREWFKDEFDKSPVPLLVLSLLARLFLSLLSSVVEPPMLSMELELPEPPPGVSTSNPYS